VKTPDHAPFRGPLAICDDELTAFIRDNKIEFPTPTPESEAEAHWEAKLFKAIESGEIGRGKPGRRPGKSKKSDAVRAVAQACLPRQADTRGKQSRLSSSKYAR
jgi:hypothetical protein